MDRGLDRNAALPPRDPVVVAAFARVVERPQSAVKAALGGLMASLSLAIGLEMLPVIGAIGLAVFGLFVWRGAPVARQAGAFGAKLVQNQQENKAPKT